MVIIILDQYQCSGIISFFGATFFYKVLTNNEDTVGKQRALSLDIWPIPTIGNVIGYSCVWTMVVAHENSMLSTRFNTCPPYFKVESLSFKVKIDMNSRLNARCLPVYCRDERTQQVSQVKNSFLCTMFSFKRIFSVTNTLQ